LLTGPLGTGKTAAIRVFAALRGCEFHSVQVTPDTSESTLIGGMQPDSEKLISWSPGIVTRAALDGATLCLDAISSGNAALLERLNLF
jgi:MoxR-like ATPase